MDLLETVEIETGPSPRFSVLWLHGLGADGHDFESVVPQLVRPDWPALRFVFPHAPIRPVTVNGGMRMGVIPVAILLSTVTIRLI